jgi:molybdopterin molybdotransferase
MVRMLTMVALPTIAEAQLRILAAASPLAPETVSIDAALGRVLAQEIRSETDIPAFACSAMDGYALTAGVADRRLTVVGESRAGAPFGNRTPVPADAAVRISTGAAVPAGADAVIRQEEVTADDGTIETHVTVAAGANIRFPGEDMRQGTTILTPGVRLGVAELGVAVAAGLGQIAVARRPRLAVLCTGDELRAPGASLGPGQIHNSNAPMLSALATRCGAVPAPAQRLPDDPAATEAALADAFATSDLLVITGGISVGPHDHVRSALERLGVRERFAGVAMRPGKPAFFGTLADRLVFGLPGNPVSAVVTFSLYAAPALAALQGADPGTTGRPTAVLRTSVQRKARLEQALVVRLEQDAAMTVAIPDTRQRSHIVTSLLGAQALALIPAGDGELTPGSTVELAELVR